MNITIAYWGLEYVDTVHATALPAPIEGSIGDPNVVLRLFQRIAELPYQGSQPAAARDWLAEVFGDSACLDLPCIEQIGPSDLTYQLGVRGAAGLTLGARH